MQSISEICTALIPFQGTRNRKFILYDSIFRLQQQFKERMNTLAWEFIARTQHPFGFKQYRAQQ